MASKANFECPVCDSYRYELIPPLEPEERRNPSYSCLCCGFVFMDPSRYKPKLVPYSTTRTAQ